MDIGTFTQLIGSVGFPIAMCIMMGWFIKDSTDKHRADINDLNEKHKIEMEGIKVALENNTMALQKLCMMIGREGDDGK